ncbi:MAG: hypothetical protein ABH871_09590, partial [Pseudomonadota bacterium]
WSNVVLQVPDINRMSAKIPVEVIDACGTRVNKEAELKVRWPEDPLKDNSLYTRISAEQACNTNPDTDLEIRLFSGKTFVAKAHFELDDIPCDQTLRYWEAKTESTDDVGSFDTTNIDKIEAHTSNPYIAEDDDGALGLYIAGLHLASKYWYREWPDWTNPTYFYGTQGTDITAYFGGWQVRWAGVPKDRRTF